MVDHRVKAPVQGQGGDHQQAAVALAFEPVGAGEVGDGGAGVGEPCVGDLDAQAVGLGQAQRAHHFAALAAGGGVFDGVGEEF